MAKTLNAELIVDKRINKKGTDYEMLLIYAKDNSGTKVLVKELYMDSALTQIVDYISKSK